MILLNIFFKDISYAKKQCLNANKNANTSVQRSASKSVFFFFIRARYFFLAFNIGHSVAETCHIFFRNTVISTSFHFLREPFFPASLFLCLFREVRKNARLHSWGWFSLALKAKQIKCSNQCSLYVWWGSKYTPSHSSCTPSGFFTWLSFCFCFFVLVEYSQTLENLWASVMYAKC